MPITDAMVEAAAEAIWEEFLDSSYEQTRRVARSALTAALSQKWEDVGSVPKDGTRFLALPEGGVRVRICYWERRKHGFFDGEGRRITVSKWCPLPPIPTQEEG